MVFASPTLLVVERTCLSNCCLCTRNQSMWDFEWSITSGVSVSWSFLSSPTCLQTRHSWDWSSQCRRTLLGMGDGGAQCGSQTPHSLGRTSAAVLIVSLVGCLTGIWVLTRLLFHGSMDMEPWTWTHGYGHWTMSSYLFHGSSFTPWAVEELSCSSSGLSHQ